MKNLLKKHFCKHNYIPITKPLELETNGIYTKGFLEIKICNKCNNTKFGISWERILIEKGKKTTRIIKTNEEKTRFL